MAGLIQVSPGDCYPSTHWSLIRRAALNDEREGEGALNELVSRYYRALLAHVRFKFGTTDEQGRDLIQGFTERKILARKLLQSADAGRGRFRTFLLNALDNYVVDDFRSRHAAIRCPAGGFISTEELPEAARDVSRAEGPDPFDREWAVAVILEAERLTREFSERKRRQDTWGVFRDGFLQPLLEGKPHPGLEQPARRHGFDSAMQASNAIVTAKRQFGKILRAVVGHYAETEKEIDEEIRALMRAFAG
jgi:DNA-directed RNA polymerase specialized sigma24 family protein